MIRVLVLSNPADRAQALALRAARRTDQHVPAAVADIIAQVRARGDAAVRELTERFDGARLESLFLDEARWDALAARCPAPVRDALALAHERVRKFHEPQIPASYSIELEGGGILRSLTIPLRRAACYVPGGRAAYPSTVIMTATVARLAGVPEVIVATPPRHDGTILPEVAAAARLAGATRILLAGGAQAVAALALGTATVPRADVIVGPGNAYVTEAKKQLSGEVRIDSLAGPTEVVIVADSSADPRQVAVDLVAQGEHDPLALSVLVTPDASLARRTVDALERELSEHPNRIAAESLGAHGAAIIARDLDEALAFADELAPEHLELLLRDAPAAVSKVPRAGAVFVGHHAPVPVGDYLAGPNHTLPTSGTARFASPLSASDFVRRQNVIEYGPRQLAADADAIESLARAEGLPGHARAIEVRSK
jgi:histidinol dehydrogenase